MNEFLVYVPKIARDVLMLNVSHGLSEIQT
jgi:hypothetical protein